MAKTFARVRGKTSSSGTLYTIIIISTVFLIAVILSNKDVIRERFFGGSDAKRLSFEYYYMDTCGHCVEFNDTGIWDKLNKETFNHISLKKYNRSEHLERVKSLGISSFPTFVVVDNSSNIIASFEEARTYEKLLAFIRKYDKE
uniref:Thioredoxin domain-containing protein n=1 Tax=viral metagenome TaxID=1070528 RepID=A0A6C0LN53_9ZZZZ